MTQVGPPRIAGGPGFIGGPGFGGPGFGIGGPAYGGSVVGPAYGVRPGFSTFGDADPISPGIQTRPGVITATGPTFVGGAPGGFRRFWSTFKINHRTLFCQKHKLNKMFIINWDNTNIQSN